MMSFEVRVRIGRTVYIQSIDGADDLASACAILLRDGLMTAEGGTDDDGPIWFPPHRIKWVRWL